MQIGARTTLFQQGGGDMEPIIDAWEVANGKLQLKKSGIFKLREDITEIGDYALYILPGLPPSNLLVTHADFSHVEVVSGVNAMYETFFSVTSLTSFDMSSLRLLSGTLGMAQAFRGTRIVNADFPSLTSITQRNQTLSRTFMSCTALTTVRFPVLVTLPSSYDNMMMYYMFEGCSALSDVYFNSLPKATVLAMGAPFGYSGTTAVFHCSDGDITYNGGAWS